MQENGKTGLTAGAAPASLDASVIGVVDQLLIGLTDKVLNVETAVRESTAQIKVMGNSVELLRALPGKMEEVELQTAAWQHEMRGLQEKVAAMQAGVSGLPERVAALDGAVKSSLEWSTTLGTIMQSLMGEVRRYTNEVASFKGGKVHHRHGLESFAWIIIVLVMGCAVLGASTYWMWSEADQYKASDIKWRGAKLFGYGAIRPYLDTIEQRYNRGPEDFGGEVQKEEDRLDALQQHNEELEEREREVEQKKAEIEELKKQGKKGHE